MFLFCPEQQLDPPQKERLGAALAEMDQQLRKLADTPWLCQPVEPGDEEVRGSWGFSLGTAGCSGFPFSTCNHRDPCGFEIKLVAILQPLIRLLKTPLLKRRGGVEKDWRREGWELVLSIILDDWGTRHPQTEWQGWPGSP